MTPTKFLIDGIDRLGKSTLIDKIQEKYGYHLVIHYDKPKVLNEFLAMAMEFTDKTGNDLLNEARHLYQIHANRNMFELMKTDIPIIFDRTHLGEMVYAPLYRGYSGGYVFQIEKDFIDEKPYTNSDNVKLILLTTSNTDMLQDDGLSFDFSKKEEEQKMFIEAFNHSNLRNKVIVDVHNGQGGYKSYAQVFDEAMNNITLQSTVF